MRACNLGSINLVQHGASRTAASYEMDWDKLARTVDMAVHFLDNVIEVNKYPLAEIDQVTKQHPQDRPGRHGLCRHAAACWALPYNSPEGVELAPEADGLHHQQHGQAASAKLAARRAAPSPCSRRASTRTRSPCATPPSPPSRPPAPCPSSPACSCGVEPVFAYVFIRNVMDGDRADRGAIPSCKRELEKPRPLQR